MVIETTPSQNANYARVLKNQVLNDRGYTDNLSLTEARMSNPDSLNPVITHLMGRESKKFPLLFLTEGQVGGKQMKEIEDVEYDWPVFGLLKLTDVVSGTEYSADQEDIALGDGYFNIIFKTQFMKNQHNIVSPNGTRARIQDRPVKVSTGWKYRCQLIRRSDQETIYASELQPGVVWAMSGGANVSESYSMGNESNTQTPGKVKNQIGIMRKSYEIGGNVANRTAVFQFKEDGISTNYWLPMEEWQHEINFKQACEESLWESTYNRDINGRIMNTCDITGHPIPMGAGVIDQIPNYDTYGILTPSKLTTVIRDITYGATDTEVMNIALFTGVGGKEVFSQALMKDANNWSVYQGALNNTITGGASTLVYGAYFTQFRHVDGHIISVTDLPYLDKGARAQNAEKHPITGLPMTSYEMHFVDMSIYDGENNVQIVTQKGRSLIRGIEQGMALIRGTKYGDYKGNKMDINLATSQDKTSIHYLKTLGVAIRRNTHCFSLYCNLS